jgi:TFIIF, beta subunit N-terminus
LVQTRHGNTKPTVQLIKNYITPFLKRNPYLGLRDSVCLEPLDHFRASEGVARHQVIMSSGEFEDDFDPDLDISKGRDKVWLVKLPKWLMEHWSKTDQDNVELAKINIS